jgi:hypothetical protein
MGEGGVSSMTESACERMLLVDPLEEASMKAHMSHFAICGVALAVGLVLAATGTVVALLPALGCILMMVVMMWAMGSMHGRSH